MFHFPLGDVAETIVRINPADMKRAGLLIVLRRAERELDNGIHLSMSIKPVDLPPLIKTIDI